MSSTILIFGASHEQFTPKHSVFIGPKALLGSQHLKSAVADAIPDSVWSTAAVVEDGRDKAAKTWVEDRSYTFAELDTKTSRNLGTVRSDLIQALVQKHVPSKDDVQLTLLLSGKEQLFAATSAVARSFPKYSRKSSAKDAARRTVLVKIVADGNVSPETYTELNILAGAVRHAAHLVDMPASELNTTALVKEVVDVASRHTATVKQTIISGAALVEQGLNAIYGVGKAASAPPALAVLEYTPPKGSSTDKKLSIVGKGIVYDTGGLSIKGTAGMCDMKTDCGGAIACLTAFEALVQLEIPFPVVCVCCIAENAVGPDSQRNDDIVTAYSGKSIEINNTDAEGRLVLADGVAFTSLHHKPTHMLDMATLTGAQMVATGQLHAGILARTKSFEDAVYDAGQRSGDWCFPLLYAPEVLEKEFESKVADMKNSVKSRTNAQSSCAGHFIESHLNDDWQGEWCHVDIAGPSWKDGRGTGFGVALVVEIARSLA